MITESKKELILIAAYCNTQKKVDVLNENIEYIKKQYPTTDIAIYAHYPINENIQKKINHFIYDYSNPLIKEKAVVTWNNIHNYKKLFKLLSDYGYAVLQKMARSLSFFNKLNYEIIYWINYDVDLKSTDVISAFKENENENVFIKFKTTQGISQADGIALYSMKMNSNIFQFLQKRVSKEMYLETSDMAEQVFKKVIDDLEIDKYELIDYEVETKIWSMNILLNSYDINEALNDF